MPTINEKLATLRVELEPMLEDLLGQMTGTASIMLRPALAFIRPQLDEIAAEQLARPADELDDLAYRALELIGSCRSDDAPAILVTPRGCRTVDLGADVDDVDVLAALDGPGWAVVLAAAGGTVDPVR